MGSWSDEIFGSDLAADVRAEYRARLEAGAADADAVGHVRRAFAEAMRDADDRRAVWIALAAVQLELGTVTDEVRGQALKAIAWCETADRDPERIPAGLDALARLRQGLGGPPPAPARAPKRKLPPGRGGEVVVVTLPVAGGEAVVYVAGPAGHDRGDDSGRVVLLFDLRPDDVTVDSVQAALLAWRRHRQRWPNGSLGRSIGCYDATGRLPARRTRVVLEHVAMPPAFARRMAGIGVIYRSADLPWVVENDVEAWTTDTWVIDPSSPDDDVY